MDTLDVVCAGEVMVEFCSSPDGGHWQQGFGGDTFNTAVYLARAGLRVSYMTRLGDDRFSNAAIKLLHGENVGTECVKQVNSRRMGLYTITNRADGERSFDYWRDQSPARELFDTAVEPPVCQYFYFSGITLAVICRDGLENLLSLLQALKRQGTQIAFDPNYRPVLWRGVEQARQAYQAVLPLCDMVFPTLEDEQALWGLADLQACQDFYAQFSVAELVIKAPDLSCHVITSDDYEVGYAASVDALDTTGAGDSFSAGYLAARVGKVDIAGAIEQAQQLAAQVVQHRGAIISR